MLIFVKDVLLCIISTKDSETNSELERERERDAYKNRSKSTVKSTVRPFRFRLIVPQLIPRTASVSILTMHNIEQSFLRITYAREIIHPLESIYEKNL